MTIPAITIFLLIGVLTALTWFIWKRKPEEAEPEIDMVTGRLRAFAAEWSRRCIAIQHLTRKQSCEIWQTAFRKQRKNREAKKWSTWDIWEIIGISDKR